MSRGHLGWTLGALFLGALRIAAQGDPFRVDTGTADRELGYADVAAADDGRFLVAWEETPPLPASGRIVARRFQEARGTADPEEVVIAAAGHPRRPVVAAAKDGGFLVAWADDAGIRALRIDGAGKPGQPAQLVFEQPIDFDLAAEPSGDGACDGKGGFALVWSTPDGSGVHSLPPAAHLQARRFCANGESAGNDLPVDDALGSNLSADPAPRIAVTANGTLFVTWRKGGVAGDVFLRAFDSSGNAISPPALGGTPVPASLLSTGLQRRPVLAAGPSGAGDFALTWESGPPVVDVDLALCLDASVHGPFGISGAHAALALQLLGTETALRDGRKIPADGTVHLSVLRYGAGNLETLIGGVRGARGEGIGNEADAEQLAQRLHLGSGPEVDELPPGGDSSAARCVCEAAFRLTGIDPCPGAEADLCPVPGTELECRTPPAPAPLGSRKALVLASQASSSAYFLAAAGPGRGEPDPAQLACRLRTAVRLARCAGVTALNAVQVSAGLFGTEVAQASGPSLAATQSAGLGEPVFPFEAEDDRGFVAGVDDSPAFARALGRTMEGELAAESGVFARIFTSDRPNPPEIQVNSTVAGDQAAPDVAADLQGNRLFVWKDLPRGRIAGQFFDPHGELIGVEQELSGAVDHPAGPRLAALGSGRFVAVWQQGGAATGSRELWARIVEAPPVSPCLAGASTLCLLGDDFRVEVDWTSDDQRSGRGQAFRLNGQAGYFTLESGDGTPREVLVAVRISPLGSARGVEMVGLTDLGLGLTVTETRTGRSFRYETRPGEPFPSYRDGETFTATAGPSKHGATTLRFESERGGPTVFYPAAEGKSQRVMAPCEPGPETLCLDDDRFRVEVKRRTASGSERGKGWNLGGLAGAFAFGDGVSLDALVKVREGCQENGRVWLYAAGLAAEAVEITVNDTATGQVRILRDGAGGNVRPLLDRRAFPCL